jgi:hypothetical protein
MSGRAVPMPWLDHTEDVFELAQLVLNGACLPKKKVAAELKKWCRKPRRVELPTPDLTFSVQPPRPRGRPGPPAQPQRRRSAPDTLARQRPGPPAQPQRRRSAPDALARQARPRPALPGVVSALDLATPVARSRRGSFKSLDGQKGLMPILHEDHETT